MVKVEVKGITNKLSFGGYTGNHTGELELVLYQIMKMTDMSRWNKGNLVFVVHEQIADTCGIFMVGLISFLWFCILGMSKDNKCQLSQGH